MLLLTENATTVMRQLAEHPDVPDGGGMRIAPPADGTDGFAIGPSSTPQLDDQVIEAEGVRVYLDPAVADQLDDKVLDAAVSAEGQVQFVLGSQ